ncbi:MAG TPA: hypothetical protein VFF04_03780, partial [Candidatus Babeliales bacterium]|nr:hypothetical protein [Candidatus Babeliales bacterium]
DSEGFTPLMQAVSRALISNNSRSTEIIKFLIAELKKRGESLDLYNNENKTAYWIAHEAKRPGIERLLLDAGANPWLSPAEVKRLKPVKLKEWEIENEKERKKRNAELIEQGKPAEEPHIPAGVLELMGQYAQ